MNWISFDEQIPSDNERCLVCYKPWKKVILLTYNSYDECWDDDEGDDYFCDFNEVDFWCSLPQYRNCD